MTDRPAVSVLMSVYNDERWLRSCISAVQAQTITNFELLVVDDASADGSLAILESFNDPRIKIYRHAERSGWMGSINELAGYARGPLLKMLCADDILSPRCLERGVAFFENNPRVGYIFSDTDLIDQTGRMTSSVRILDHTRVLSGIESDAINLQRGCVTSTSGMFVSTEMWQVLRGLRDVTRKNPEQWPNVEDFDLMARLHRLAPVGYIAEPLVGIRYHTGQVQIHPVGSVLSIEGYLFVLRAMGDRLVDERVMDRDAAEWTIVKLVADTKVAIALWHIRTGQVRAAVRVLSQIQRSTSLRRVLWRWAAMHGPPLLRSLFRRAVRGVEV